MDATVPCAQTQSFPISPQLGSILPQFWNRIVLVLMSVIVSLGVGLRVSTFADSRDLWIDEAMLALNIVERDYAGLTRPLDRNQAAPLLFLWAVKAATEFFGTNEQVFRMVPFGASLLSLVLFLRLAYRVLPDSAARFAVALFALSPYLIGYAAECKQYSTDCLFAVLLLSAGVHLLESLAVRGRWLLLAVLGSVAIWSSHPSLFLLGGIGAALLWYSLLHRDVTTLRRLVLVAGIWLANFGAMYAFMLRSLGTNDYLVAYWAEHFLPFPPKSFRDLGWVVSHVFQFFHYPGGFPNHDGFRLTGIAALLAMTGCCVFYWSQVRQVVLVMLVVPALLAMAASAFERYPFGGRLLLFLVPAALIVLAQGTIWLGEQFAPRMMLVGVVLHLLFVVGSLAVSLDQVQHPPRAEQIRSTLDHIRDHWQPGDRVYLYNGAGNSGSGPAFRFYASQYPLPHEALVLGRVARSTPTDYLEDVRSAAKTPGRIWVLFSHRYQDEETLICAYFDSAGRCLGQHEAPGAAVYLYELMPME
jgi:hypothetical protein